VTNRDKRMALERVFGFLCTLEDPSLKENLSPIPFPLPWGYSFNEYIRDLENNQLGEKQVVKVWTGR